MGIKRKIFLSFLFVGLLLFLSAVIFSVELFRLRNITGETLDHKLKTVELTKSLFALAEDQNNFVIAKVARNPEQGDPAIGRNEAKFLEILNEIRPDYADSVEFKVVANSIENYNRVTAQMPDTLALSGFFDYYQSSYLDMVFSIGDFMILVQNDVIAGTMETENKSYRASKIAVVTLVAGIFLLAILYILINKYIIDSVLEIKKALENHVNSGLPFKTEVHAHAEILQLQRDIEQLSDISKNEERQ